MGKSEIGLLLSCQHPREFPRPLSAGNRLDLRRSTALACLLADAKVDVCKRRHLRQVCHHNHLGVPSQACQASSNLGCGLSTHTSIDLVKDHGWRQSAAAEHSFECEHHP